ncbi:hypothetical protein AQUCO_01600435v1 [Aquilegia coerulea]|uniref:Uncharacterized protein n=1 Tax=Aquilegia coerulea TaxID=218851 RepID=A0A2G5DRL8_AQUCA|nr:hypothetical protein AQUCO_01600435v1 [Aquilegia coerulea]
MISHSTMRNFPHAFYIKRTLITIAHDVLCFVTIIGVVRCAHVLYIGIKKSCYDQLIALGSLEVHLTHP